MNLIDTPIYDGFVTLVQPSNLKVPQHSYEIMVKGIFSGLATFLRDSKNTESASAIIVTDFKGEKIFAAYVSYEEPSGEEDTAGNWLIDFTFDVDNIPEGARVIDFKQPECFQSFISAANNNGYVYTSDSTLITVVIAVFRSIIDYLDVNATDKEELTVEDPGVFTASVVIDNGVKLFGIVVDEEIKAIVKGSGDELLSKANITVE